MASHAGIRKDSWTPRDRTLLALGVTCDVCNKYNFAGDRYKCLACYDYDLCETCFDDKATSQNHEVDHPMQCILTRNDFGAAPPATRAYAAMNFQFSFQSDITARRKRRRATSRRTRVRSAARTATKARADC